MPTFTELASQSDYPVIRSQRRDGATLIATRVPTADIRLERWGWILTLSNVDGQAIEDDIETLKNTTGRQFPKVYLMPDMQNYIEKWGCIEWEEGYHQNGHQSFSQISATSLSTDIVGPALRKEAHSRKVDKCGTVFVTDDRSRRFW